MQEFKLEQIAYSVPNIDVAKSHFEKCLGLVRGNWVDDVVVAKGAMALSPITITNKAELAFNYQAGIELELIHYLEGNNWHDQSGRTSSVHPFLSHLGMHVSSLQQMDEWKEQMYLAGINIAQEVKTISHTNQELIDLKQRYHYVVFDSRYQIGFDLKLIRRINYVD